MTLTQNHLKLLIFSSLFYSLSLSAAAPHIPFTILETKSHNEKAFTQGYVYSQGLLFESSGKYGESFIQSLDAETGAVLRKASLPGGIFAEGLAINGDELFLLTWKKQTLIRLHKKTHKILRTQRYKGEGWGLTLANNFFVMSNGSHYLSFRDTESFSEQKKITVIDGNKKITRLNELDFDGRAIWANQWKSNTIFKINAETGKVQAKVDLTGLVPKNLPDPHESVLNGIAYVPEKKAFWITGKYWPLRYLLKIHDVETGNPPPID